MARRMGALVAAFLRLMLLPVILIGVPAWPAVGLLCVVPVVGIFAIPLFLLLTALLLYSVAWFSYLLFAQADPPASSRHGTLAPFVPFLPYSPMRCLKINWAAFTYTTSAVKFVLPAVLDWSYRRVMVLGTQGGGGIVKENILYGSPYPNKRLDVYLPPSTGTGRARGPTQVQGSVAASMRHRKHSTQFAEPAAAETAADTFSDAVDADATPRPDGNSNGARSVIRTPMIIVVPSPMPPLKWTQHRKTYLQLALRLRRMGFCVVVPDLTWYPEGRVNASVVDLRLVLRWAADNAKRYGADHRRIYLLAHGMSAHLVMLTLTQEAVVLSREGFIQRQSDLQAKRETLVNWDSEADDTIIPHAAHAGHASFAAAPSTTSIGSVDAPTDEHAWVDELGDDDLPPGAVMNGDETLDSITSRRRAPGLGGRDAATGIGSNITFPSSTPSTARRTDELNGRDTADIVTSISNGLRRVEIYEPEIALPPVAGVMLLAGVFDVIKCFRNESDRGVEHLSVLRRSCGPSHTACLLHSPAHLLYAAKNILDISLLPPKFLLVHGGKDAVVDVSQSTLLKTLLGGIGVEEVRLRAYRELGHVEAVASLFLGMGKASTRYSKQILRDIDDFVID